MITPPARPYTAEMIAVVRRLAAMPSGTYRRDDRYKLAARRTGASPDVLRVLVCQARAGREPRSWRYL